jgi:CheY-like chemotaxis protein/PAS domain-containing protein
MKPDKHFAIAASTVLAVAGLIALTWIGTMQAVRAQRVETADRVTATLANQALTFSEQINRQFLALDQTLRTLAASWEASPGHFDLEASRRQAVVLAGLSRDIILTDENGIIRQSSVNEAIGQNASGQDYFRALADPANAGDSLPGEKQNGLFVGAPTIDGIMRQWHMNVARALHFPDGSFAGLIDTDYRLTAITDVFAETDLGSGAFMTLAGLDDGKLRGAVGGASVNPDATVGDTPMLAAIREADNGIWTGPSANDAVRRIHAFRRIPGRNLVVVVAMDQDVAMHPATLWRVDAEFYAGCITVLLAGMALIVVQGTRRGRRHDAATAEDRAMLAASNAQFEVASAMAAAKAEQLEATLAGMTDGVAIVDAHNCLVEWNARFPERAGVPADILRVGLPMEEILRAQIHTGRFGPIADPEAEVERRMARLQARPLGVTQQQGPDGNMLELRRNRLPDGGFLTLYADITDQKRVEAALREAKEEAAKAAPSRPEAKAGMGLGGRTPVSMDASTAAIGDRQGAPLTRRRLPRTRILLARDIETDQRVTATLLRCAGHHVELVASGPSAIGAIQTAPYDIVLVDNSMPGITGEETARIIRGLPEPARSTPIIALTENAGTENAGTENAGTENAAPQDEAVFEAAGMNGILGKPVSLAALLDTIQRSVWSAPALQAASTKLGLPAGDADVARIVPVLAEARINGLRSDLPPAVFANLVEECLADMDHRLPALRRALAAGAPGAIMAHAHALVGMASSYGMIALEVRLRTIMEVARDPDMNLLDPTIVTGLEADFAQAARDLRAMLGQQAA